MGSKQSCSELSLIALKLVTASANLFREGTVGGKLEIGFKAAYKAEDEKLIDKNNPACVSLTMTIAGFEQSGSENGSEPVKAFEVETTMRGTFRPNEGKTLSFDQLRGCHKWIIPQLYIPLREYVSNTLDRLGIRYQLPLNYPYEAERENASENEPSSWR
jgi:hypothetical protein